MSVVNLKMIDQMIEKAVDYQSPEKYLTELANLIIPFLNIDQNSQTINYNSLFKREIEQTSKRFISFCLLRIYSIHPKLIINSSVKHNIHNLFKKSIPEVYDSLDINEKTETYDIESKLSSFVKELESRIIEKFTTEIDLHFIGLFGNTYRSTIKNQTVKPLLNQFFGNRTIWQLFDRAFKILEEYKNSDANKKFQLYQESIDILDGIIETSGDTGTKYSIDFIQKNFIRIKDVLVIDFESNPYSKPAILTIKCTEKKYPFFKNANQIIQLLIENSSTGYANDTKVKISLYSDDIIKLKTTEQYIGFIKNSSIIEFEYDGLAYSDNIVIIGEIGWTNFNNEKCKKEFEIELSGQEMNIDWSSIENEEPYDLEPVTDENEFIGRKKIINSLRKIRKKITSSYVFGQRRVGKTSIVKTLQSIIQSENILVIYIEAGDWSNATSPHKSMGDLGNIICNKIKRSNKKFSSIITPDFDGSFNRITDFLDEVTVVDNTFEVLIILDEFDRISSELLCQGEVGKSFMLTIRSISNRDNFGFILVGGEKLEYLLSQWQEFNKFKPIRVDYFDKQAEWEDFKNLIKYPVVNILEISDQAVDYIYNQTSGNPYFTKKICIELFSLMASNRDSHVTQVEAKKATDIARYKNNIGATDFSHFWKDGIKEKEEKEEEISINRKKVLLSIGQILRSNQKANKQNIIDKCISNGLDELLAEKTLEEFVQRKIIELTGSDYKFVVKFFEDWLTSNGLDIIITTFKEEQSIHLKKIYEDQIKVNYIELVTLTKGWKTYKGQEITTEKVRQWLDQFNGIESQRLIFNLLENIKFYTNIEIREHLEGLFVEVRKEIRKANQNYVSKKASERKTSGIIVSYLDPNPAKSGSEYAKIFVEVNNIYKDNSTEPEKIGIKLSELNDINALVFVDDFLGTGQSVIENLDPILEKYDELLVEKEIIVVIGVITGYQEAKHRVEEFAQKYGVKMFLKVMVPLDNKDKCFDDNSQIYQKSIQRNQAMNICRTVGLQLENKNPLGFGNCQATIVFPNTCPNNTLPILWKETKDWNPLFKRG